MTTNGSGPEPLLSCHGLHVSYGPVQILFGVDFDVAEGELVALLGTNGAGKSTLLKAISGLVPVQGGKVRFGGKDHSHTNAEGRAAAGIALMPGGKGIFPSLTVDDNPGGGARFTMSLPRRGAAEVA